MIALMRQAPPEVADPALPEALGLVVVAEGAGQELMPRGKDGGETDASGNTRFQDIGQYLVDEITRAFSSGWNAATVKYIDPSYISRAAPAIAGDAIFCGTLAQDAVHAAMAGKTGMVVGLWGGRTTHVPLTAATGQQKVISLDSSFWQNVMEVTGQPAIFGKRCPPKA